MRRHAMSWVAWTITFLCACSASIPALPVQPRDASGPVVLVIHPGGYKPVDLTREELQQGVRMLYANGPLPGLPKNARSRFLFAGDNAMHRLKAEGYLQWCQRITGQRSDCWDDLNASGELDDEGATFVALHFALEEALEDAASAVRAMTPAQVRAMLSLMFLGMIVELLSPEPVTKVLFIASMTNLIAFVGVDVFNHVVKGFVELLDELGRTRDFEGIRLAGFHYGQRIGPTVARIVVMVATYGIAKFAGLFKGSVQDLPGGSRAATLAEAQGFRLPDVEGARSVTLAADGSVIIELSATTAVAAVSRSDSAPREQEPVAPDDEHDSRVLASNMEKAGVHRPRGAAAHHIVAGKARAAEVARRVLAKFGIGINDAENGVYLPCNSKAPCEALGTVHSSLHTNSYYKAIDELLLAARSRDEVLEILADIRSRLEAGWKP
jgi:HNH/ENDO VII superfamily nuclease